MRGVVVMALVSRSTMRKILSSKFEKVDERKAAKEAKKNLKRQGFKFW